jgi:photosystem II stability/assembly factor-like uncharacterized protein
VVKLAARRDRAWPEMGVEMIRKFITAGAVLGAVLLLPLLASASDTQHCYLRDASSPAASTAYLLCEQGLVYGTTDGGATWAAHDTGATVILHAIAFIDGTRGFVAGDSGTLLATEDGGKTWQPRTSGSKENLLTVFALGNLVWTAGFDGALLHSTDGGRTWSKQTSGTTMALESIFFLDADHGWSVGWSGTILRTQDGGKTWESIKSKAASWTLDAVRFRDAKNGWAVGFSGQLLRSRDGGATWEAQKSPVQSWLTSVAADHANRLWIAADSQLLVSEDGGETWKAVVLDGNYFVCRVFPVGDAMWALGELGLLKQTGTGLEWKHDESFVPAGAHISNTLEEPASGAAAAPGKSK